MNKKINNLKLSFKVHKNDEGISEVKMVDTKKTPKKEKKIKEKKEKASKQPKNVANQQLLEQMTQNMKKDLKATSHTTYNTEKKSIVVVKKDLQDPTDKQVDRQIKNASTSHDQENKVDNENQNVRTKVRHWELRWVKVNNIYEWEQDVWIRKWVREAQDDGTILKDRQVIFKCKVVECQKQFHDIALLKKHQLTHGEKLFVCQVPGCGKKFLDNSKLRRHQLVHTGERPHKCLQCGRLFSLDFNLKTHMRTHTGEKPYVCKFPGCNRRFTQSSNLSAHEKVHFLKENDPSVPTIDFDEEDVKEDSVHQINTAPEQQ